MALSQLNESTPSPRADDARALGTDQGQRDRGVRAVHSARRTAWREHADLVRALPERIVAAGMVGVPQAPVGPSGHLSPRVDETLRCPQNVDRVLSAGYACASRSIH